MKHYAVNDWGLLISGGDMEEIAEAYNEKLNAEYYLDKYALADEMELAVYTEVDGEFVPFENAENKEDLDAELFFVLQLDRYPELFVQAYNSIDEIEAEVRGKTEKYILKEFDYRANLGTIIGVVLE